MSHDTIKQTYCRTTWSDRGQKKGKIYGIRPAFGNEIELASINIHFPVTDAYEDVIFEKEKANKRLNE